MNRGVLKTPISLGVQPQPPTMDYFPTDDHAENVNIPVDGWPTLAKIVSEHPELEAFPTFTDLSIKSLLYYHAELISLRQKLHKAEWKDHRQSGNDSSNFSFFARDLRLFIVARDKAIKNHKEVPEQWVIIEKIRTTLQKYHAALLQFSEVVALREADNCNIRTLKDCIKECYEGGLTGHGAQTWGEISETPPNPKSLLKLFWGLFTGFFVSPDGERKQIDKIFQEHLIVPHKGSKPDGLTQWVKQSFIPFYDHLRENYFHPVWLCIVSFLGSLHRIWRKLCPEKQLRVDEEKRSSVPSTSSNSGPSSPTLTNSSSASASDVNNLNHYITNNLNHYSGSWIVRITSILTTVVACLLPTVAITVLARVHSMGSILGLIGLFTALFAIGLILLSSSSSRVEIFTATAAFSAVMVVFVQNQIGTQYSRN